MLVSYYMWLGFMNREVRFYYMWSFINGLLLQVVFYVVLGFMNVQVIFINVREVLNTSGLLNGLLLQSGLLNGLLLQVVFIKVRSLITSGLYEWSLITSGRLGFIQVVLYKWSLSNEWSFTGGVL